VIVNANAQVRRKPTRHGRLWAPMTKQEVYREPLKAPSQMEIHPGYLRLCRSSDAQSFQQHLGADLPS